MTSTTAEEGRPSEPVGKAKPASGRVWIALTAFGCVLLLLSGVYPGVGRDLAFFGILFGLVVVPLATLAILSLIAILFLRGQLALLWIPWRHCSIAAGLFALTILLFVIDLPLRAGFWISHRSFEKQLPNVPASDGYDGNDNFNRFVGVYRVDNAFTDARGGIYFRTHSGPDGIGPDTMSYGFAYKPNSEGTPFGQAHYETQRMRGDWYWFCASDDW